MLRTPRFITFTGADDFTSIESMAQLSKQYPIEWGILFSPRHQGQGSALRYPSLAFANEVRAAGLALSAHLCGRHVRDLLAHGTIDLSLVGFERAQINNVEIGVEANVETVRAWAEINRVQAIMQCTGEFPRAEGRISWLFDQSCGAGVVPKNWPQPSVDFCGYAGGIKPSNVKALVGKIEAKQFWIDMETGVRGEHDHFSIDLCRQVCEAVYGPGRQSDAAPITTTTGQTIDPRCAWPFPGAKR